MEENENTEVQVDEYNPLSGGADIQTYSDFGTTDRPYGFQGEMSEVGPEYTWIDTIGAALKMENTVGSVWDKTNYKLTYGGYSEEIDDDFDAVDFVKNNQIPTEYIDRFQSVRNADEAKYVSGKIEKELEARRILDESGTKGVISMLGAGILDLPSILPLGAAVRIGKGGATIASGVRRGAMAAAVDATATEAILQGSQVTRTIEDSAINIAGSAFLGGLLGGAASGIAAKLKGVDVEKIGSEMETLKEINMPPSIKMSDQVALADSVGAMATPENLKVFTSTPEGQAIMNFKKTSVLGADIPANAFSAYLNTMGRVSPAVRVAMSPFSKISEIGEKLAFLDLRRNKINNGQAIEQSAEAQLDFEFRSRVGDVNRLSRDVVKQQSKELKAAGKKPMKSDEFSRAVTQAMRRMDNPDDLGIPEESKKHVRQMAARLRKTHG